jgi:hypothetical protein
MIGPDMTNVFFSGSGVLDLFVCLPKKLKNCDVRLSQSRWLRLGVKDTAGERGGDEGEVSKDETDILWLKFPFVFLKTSYRSKASSRRDVESSSVSVRSTVGTGGRFFEAVDAMETR